MLAAHGQDKDGMHHLKFEDRNELNTPTTSLLSAICPTTQGCGKRDIFFGACGSRSAFRHIDDLPAGSEAVSLADMGESISLSTSFPREIAQSSNPLTADGLLETYLPLHQSFSSVASYVSGTGGKPYSHQLSTRLGRQFSSEQKAAVHKRWDSQLGSSKCDELMQEITSAGSMGDLYGIRMGECLAIEKAASYS